jgi:hypothetical protein
VNRAGVSYSMPAQRLAQKAAKAGGRRIPGAA